MTLRRALLSPIRLAGRPVWRRGWAKLEARLLPIDRRLLALDHKVDHANGRAEHAAAASERIDAMLPRLSTIEDGWRQHIPAFLNAAASVRAFGFELTNQRTANAAASARQDSALADARKELSVGQFDLKVRLDTVQHDLQTLADDQAGTVRPALDTLRTAAADLQNELRGSIEAMRAEAAQVRAELAETRGTLHPAMASLTNEVRAIAAMTDTAVHDAQDRIEFVRREILFEMLHGTTKAPMAEVPETRIVAPDKIAAAGNAMRLNIGCGHIPLDGYINVDQRALPGVDIVAEAGSIPVEPGSVCEVFSAHLLEHFPQEALRRRLLPYWRGLLSSGGMFRAVVPDGQAMLEGISAGHYEFEEFREVLFGAQDYAGDFHYNLYTPDSLSNLLREANFDHIEVPVRGRRNGKCFEFEISAVRA